MSGAAHLPLPGPGGLPVYPGLPSVNPIGELSHQAASAVISSLTEAVAQAASWMLIKVSDLVESSTSIDLSARWLDPLASQSGRLALEILPPILMAATIGAVVRQDLSRLWRVWGVGLPVALLVGAMAPQLTAMLLAVTDQMTSAMAAGSATRLDHSTAKLILGALGSGDPPLVELAVGALVMAGALLVWSELVLRAAAVYLAVLLMPLSLACYVWPATAAWARRGVETVVALALSKLVIVSALSLGLAALGGTGSNVVVAGAVLLVAGFAPFAAFRLAPFVEASLIGHLEGLSRRAWRAAGSAGSFVASGGASSPATRLLWSISQPSPSESSAPRPVRPLGLEPLASAGPNPGGASVLDLGGPKGRGGSTPARTLGRGPEQRSVPDA